MTLRPEPYRAFEREEVYAALDALAQEAAARGVSMSALALAWVLCQARVDAAVIGPRRPEHVDEAVAALTTPLSHDLVARLGDLFTIAIEDRR